MGLSEIMPAVSGDNAVMGVGRAGLFATASGLAGLLTTANLAWLAGIALGLGTLVCQMWWEWYRQSRRAHLDIELYKAQLRKKAQDSGLDIMVIKAFKESPDPDAN